jgi:outer membrane immunogenic protein
LNNFVSLLGVSTAAFIATPAAAQVAAPTGARVEAVVGYDRVSYDLEDTFGIDDSVHMSGVLLGVGVGYDFAVSSGVSLGLDAEISGSTADRKESYVGDLEGYDVDGTGKISAGRDLYAGARVTFAVSPTTNVYLKGGYTNARVKASVEGMVDGEQVSMSDAANGDGVRAGLGAQFAIGANSYVGAEYRYSNYEHNVTRNQIAATFGLRF